MGEEKRHQMMQNLFGDQSDQSEEEEEDDEEEEVDSEHESNPDPAPNQAPMETQSASDEEVDQPPENHPASTAVRNVFGDSDDEQEDEYTLPHHPISPVEVEHQGGEGYGGEEEDVDVEVEEVEEEEEEDGSFGKIPRIIDHDIDNDNDNLVPDEDQQARYESEEEENVEAKIVKEKPVGPPMELEIPMRPPPAHPEMMNMIKVSNIMGIDPKPFDPKTYVEEDTFMTDESGSKKRIRLENNIVRWRTVKKPDGSIARQSNARFVRWSDGSLQLLIGNEVLDITVQEAQHDQAHLFLRHQKGILQSQGRILRKMRFIPSSLSSNSHRLLTALVDSRHKKVHRVKNCVTDIDPEREKEEKERAESQSIRANLLLSRKREKVSRKYAPTVDRRRQLSPGFLEDALDEEDEAEYYDSRHSRNRFDEDLEVETRAERRILNAKKSQGGRDIPRKSSMSGGKSSHRQDDYSESDRGESEYETDGEEIEDEEERSPPPRRRNVGAEQEYEEEEDEEEEDHEEARRNDLSEDEAEEPKHKVKESGHSLKRKGIESDEDSPPRKATTHRRMAVVYDSDED